MQKYKELDFTKFSMPRKIIVTIFMILFFMSIALVVIPMRGGAGMNVGVWFPTVYFFMLFAVTYTLDVLKKFLKKIYRPLIVLFYTGMALFMIAFSVFCVLIMGYTSADLPENPDLIIVLGCQVKGHNPGNLLRFRLETAVETLNKYPDATCIVSGGQGPDEIIQESRVMKQYLVDKGIPESRIFEEDESSSSFENLIFSQKIIEDNNIKHENIVIITSEYHVPRSVLIANRIFTESDIYAVKSNTLFALFTSGIVREFFAFVKSYIFDKV